MTTILQVERALLELDGATFQRLCDAYLTHDGLTSWVSIGLPTGTRKTRAGTPDTLGVGADGLTLVEVTTEQDNLGAKLLRDVRKCLDPSRSQIAVASIRRIILCFTGHLPTKAAASLHSLVQSHGIELKLIGPHRLAQDLRFRFPTLGAEFLGLPIDTGQLLTPAAFVEAQDATATQTNLDAPFYGREAELTQIGEALTRGDIVVLLGPAGVGKTRLALEAARSVSLGASPSTVLCLRSRGASAFADLQAALEARGRCLLLIDDANRVSGLAGLLDIAGERRAERDVRVVITVRDYAADAVLGLVQERTSPAVVRVTPFSDTEIGQLLERGFGVKNHHYQERIAELAQGNARIAVMAARIATSAATLASLHDASGVYEQFFEPVRTQCPPLQDPTSLRALATVALLGRLLLDRPDQMANASHLHRLGPSDLLVCLDRLHDAELVDRYENAVVRVSDQVLATYVVYLALFKRHLIDPKEVLRRLYPMRRSALLEQLGAVLRTFRQPAVLEQVEAAVHAVWEEAAQSWPPEVFESFVLTFADVRPREALHMAIRKLAAAAPDPAPGELRVVVSHQESVTDSPTLLLGRFRHDSTLMPVAIHAVIDEAERHPGRIPSLLRMLWERYGFSRHSHWERLGPEHILMDVLWSRAAEGQAVVPGRMFAVLAEQALRTHHDEHESGRGGMSINLYRFDLPNTDGVRQFRRAVWARLLTLLQVPALRGAVLATVRNFATGGLRVADAELVKADLAVLEPALLSRLDPDCPGDVAAARDLRNLRERFGLGVPAGYAPLIASPLGRLAELLLRDRQFRREHGWKADAARRSARLAAYGARLDGDIETFVCQVAALLGPYSDHDAWQIRQGATSVLHEAGCRWPEAFARWLGRTLADGNPLQLHPAPLVRTAIQVFGPTPARALLEAAPEAVRPMWLAEWFAQLPPTQWTKAEADACAALIEESPPRLVWRMGDLIDRICRADAARGRLLLRHLADRAQNEPEVGLIVADAFQHPDLQRPSVEALRADPETFEMLYLAVDAVDPHIDHRAELFSELVTVRPDFAPRWVAHVLAREEADPRRDDNREYSTLWRRPDWREVLDGMCRAIIASSNGSWYRDSYLHVLMRMVDGTPDALEIASRQDALLAAVLEETIGDDERMGRLFAGIARLPVDRRAPLIGRYLSLTPSVTQFERVMLEPTMWMYEGSRVPTLRLRREFIERLLAYCDRPALLEHATILEARLKELDSELASARREDFIGR